MQRQILKADEMKKLSGATWEDAQSECYLHCLHEGIYIGESTPGND
jgi:hypothetical protein